MVMKTQNKTNSNGHGKLNDDCVDAGPKLTGGTVVENGNSELRQSPRVKRSTDENFAYNMNHQNRGHFVVFNHKIFKRPDDTREGTDKDVLLMKSAAAVLGFNKVSVYHDLPKDKLLKTVTNYAKLDHTHNDCFACVILTHGSSDDVLQAKDESYQLKDITRLFSPDICPTLAGKPKLFFIQACRGTELDHGAKYDVVDGPITPNKETTETVRIPLEADFLLAHSTCSDYYSWRNKSDGSVFMQTLQNAFFEFGTRLELMQILTRVNRRVAREFESRSNDEKFHGKKQIPSVTTRLTAEVYFPVKKRVTSI